MLTIEQLQRRLVLLNAAAQGLNDALIKDGHYGDGTDVNEENSGLVGKYITDLFILADTKDDYSETCFMTDAEYAVKTLSKALLKNAFYNKQ